MVCVPPKHSCGMRAVLKRRTLLSLNSNQSPSVPDDQGEEEEDDEVEEDEDEEEELEEDEEEEDEEEEAVLGRI